MKTENKKSPLQSQTKRKVRFDNELSRFRAVTEEVDGQTMRRIRGYAILFDTPGKPWLGSVWVEKVDKKALEGVDFSKLVILLDHNTNWVLGRVGKNMRAVVDDTGLFVEVTLGDTWIDDYVFDRVQKEIIDGMSFWFDSQSMIATDWENKIDVILKINQVYEVSLVVFPAYEETVAIVDNSPTDQPPQDEESGEDDELKKQALIDLIEQL